MREISGQTDLRTSRRALILFLVNAAFYLSFPLRDGPSLSPDSQSYIGMDPSREPLYPLFLLVFRTLFGGTGTVHGQPAALFAAVIVQALFTAAVVTYAVLTLDRAIPARALSPFLRLLLLCLCLWMPELLNRFAAKRGATYSESILTEALGLPLFLLFLVLLFRWFRDTRARYLFGAGIVFFLCISLRKQLLFTGILFVFLSFVIDLLSRRKFRRFATVLAVTAAAFLLSVLFDCTFQSAVHGKFTQHTGNAMGIDCVLLYTAKQEDRLYFTDDPETQALFDDIYAEMTARGVRYDDVPAGTDWFEAATHFADSYDVIGYEIMNPLVEEQIRRTDPQIRGIDYALAVDLVETKLRNGLLHQDLSRLAVVWIRNIRKGFVNSILRAGALLNMAAAALYAVYIALLVLLLLRRDRSGAALFGFIVLAAITVNVVVVGAVIFPQTRYMIYGMGPFYAALLRMACQVFRVAAGYPVCTGAASGRHK